jgi:hypothetical protein
LFAWRVVTAVHTTKAEDEESPAAGGTKLSIRIFMPLGFFIISLSGELNANIAL